MLNFVRILYSLFALIIINVLYIIVYKRIDGFLLRRQGRASTRTHGSYNSALFRLLFKFIRVGVFNTMKMEVDSCSAVKTWLTSTGSESFTLRF